MSQFNAFDIGELLGESVIDGVQKQIAAAAAKLAPVIKQIANSLGPLTVATKLIVASVKLVGFALKGLAKGLGIVGKAIGASVKFIGSKLGSLGRGIMTVGKFIGGFAKGLASPIIKAFGKMKSGLSKFTSKVRKSKTWSKLSTGIDKLASKAYKWQRAVSKSKTVKAVKAIGNAFKGMAGASLQMFAIEQLMKLIEPFMKLLEPVIVIFDILNGLLSALVGEILVAIMPAFQPLFDALIGLMPHFTEVGKIIGEFVSPAISFIVGLFTDFKGTLDLIMTALAPVGNWFKDAIGIFAGLGDASDKVSGGFNAMIVDLDAVKAAAKLVGDFISDNFTKALSAIKEKFDFIITPIANFIAKIKNVGSAFEAIKLVFDTIITIIGGTFTKVFETIETKINGLKLILAGLFGEDSFVVKGFTFLVDFIKGIMNTMISVINSPIAGINELIPGSKNDLATIPLLAEGGIATRATMGIFGEAGPEAIIPLDRMGDFGMNEEILSELRMQNRMMKDQLQIQRKNRLVTM